MDNSLSEETSSGCPLDETTDVLHTGETDDPKEKKQYGLSAQTEEPGGSVVVKMDEAGGVTGVVNSAAEEAIAQSVTAMVTAGDDEPGQTLELEKQVERKSGGGPNAVNCIVVAAENTVKEIKEQRGETQLPVVDCEQNTATSEYTTVEEKISSAGGDLNDKRRASLEISSSDGEPLSRMDSEDSISSTLMDMESTVSSGRSTPAMMMDHGSGSTLSSAKTVAYACRWDLCLQSFNSSPDLAEHIRGVHVDGQKGGVFVCLWKSCKVYNTPSTSPSWLQRHMLTHSGDRPFKCVVGGCNASFASQGGLARHVPSHFSQQSSKLKEDSPAKAALRRKKLKNKRRRSLPRPHDFFDAQTMDAIRHRAICLNLATHIEGAGNGHSLVFHSAVLARRKEGSGKVKVLLHWSPEDILPDVWVSEAERSQLKTKVVHLSQLPQDTATLLDPNIYRALPQKRLRMSI